MKRILFAVVIASLSGLVGCASQGQAYEEKPVNHQTTAEDLAYVKSDKPLTGTSATLWVNGLGCPLCATGIDLQLARLPGVSNVKVDLSVGRVELVLGPKAALSPARLSEAVEDAGFTLVKVESR